MTVDATSFDAIVVGFCISGGCAAVLDAAYASAGLGQKIALPFRPKRIARPIDLWKKPELARAAL